MWYTIASLSDLQQRTEFGFVIERGETFLEGFVVYAAERFYVYRNECPHQGVSLNWHPHRFFDPSQQFIQCAMHGALFQIEDGLCIHGPCVRRRLTPLTWRECEHQLQVHWPL